MLELRRRLLLVLWSLLLVVAPRSRVFVWADERLEAVGRRLILREAERRARAHLLAKLTAELRDEPTDYVTTTVRLEAGEAKRA